MTILYHGSAYKQDELMPGFKRSGEKVQWDMTESNEWLYASLRRDDAISMGFASAIEKAYEMDRYSHDKNNIIIQFRTEIPDEKDLRRFIIYLYEIEMEIRDGWVLNKNKFNGMEGEYRTKHTVTAIKDCNVVDLTEWLSDKQLILTTQRPEHLKWA